MRKEFETIAQYKEQMRAMLYLTVACCFHRLFLTSLIIVLWKNTTE